MNNQDFSEFLQDSEEIAFRLQEWDCVENIANLNVENYVMNLL